MPDSANISKYIKRKKKKDCIAPRQDTDLASAYELTERRKVNKNSGGGKKNILIDPNIVDSKYPNFQMLKKIE